MSSTRFPITRKYFHLLRNGFMKIGQFMILPWKWACNECSGKLCDDTANTNNHIVNILLKSCAVCGAARAASCCCVKSPLALGGSAVTIPLGGSAAIILSVIAGVTTPLVLASDVVSECSQSTNKEDGNPAESVTAQDNNISACDLVFKPQN